MINKLNPKNLIIGTANFSMNYGLKNNKKKLSEQKKKILFKYIKKKQIRFFDTSQEYLKTENFLGNQNLKKKLIISKIIFRENKISFNYVEKLIEDSLNKLKTKYLYGLLFHRINDLKGNKGKKIFSFLNKLKKKGKIKKIGVSINSPNDINIFYGKFPIDIVQLPINIFDQRLINSGWLDKLKKKNIEIHARSIFLQGVLLMKFKNLPKYFLKFEKNFITWEHWLKKNNISKFNACLNFILNLKIDKLVVGIDKKQDLMQIINFRKDKKKKNYSHLSSKNLKLIFPKLWKKN